MGREKILLPFGKSTMLGTVLAKLAAAGVPTIAAILRADLPEAHRVARAAGGSADQPDPDAEMLVSPGWAWRAFSRRRTPLHLAGGPSRGVADTLRLLIDRASRQAALLPVHAGRRGHPALAGAEVLAEIARIPDDEGLRWLWRERADSVLEVAVDDPGVIENLDDPEAYERARRREEERAGGNRPGR